MDKLIVLLNGRISRRGGARHLAIVSRDLAPLQPCDNVFWVLDRGAMSSTGRRKDRREGEGTDTRSCSCLLDMISAELRVRVFGDVQASGVRRWFSVYSLVGGKHRSCPGGSNKVL